MDLTDQFDAWAIRVKQELDGLHDFYEHSNKVWEVFVRWTLGGNTLYVRNAVTGNEANEKALVDRTDHYRDRYLLTLTFQQNVSLFEFYFFDLLKLLLLRNPYPLAHKSLELAELLAAPDK